MSNVQYFVKKLNIDAFILWLDSIMNLEKTGQLHTANFLRRLPHSTSLVYHSLLYLWFLCYLKMINSLYSEQSPYPELIANIASSISNHVLCKYYINVVRKC